jgi:hypothetical protein
LVCPLRQKNKVANAVSVTIKLMPLLELVAVNADTWVVPKAATSAVCIAAI